MIKCLVCGAFLQSIRSKESIAWDWFTGYLPVTVHFCSHHKTNDLRNKLLAISRLKPENWDRRERNFVEALQNRNFTARPAAQDGE